MSHEHSDIINTDEQMYIKYFRYIDNLTIKKENKKK